MVWWKFGQNRQKSQSDMGIRIDRKGRVFLQSDTGDLELKLKEISGGQLIYEPLAIGKGAFAERLLLNKYEDFLKEADAKIEIECFAIDLANRTTPLNYFYQADVVDTYGLGISPEAQKRLIAIHKPEIRYEMTPTRSQSMDWEKDKIALWGVCGDRFQSSSRFEFDPNQVLQKQGVLYVPLMCLHTTLFEVATAQKMKLPHSSYYYSNVDIYRDQVVAAATYDDKGAGHRSVLAIDQNSGAVNLQVQDAKGKVLKQSKESIAQATQELVDYLTPLCANKPPAQSAKATEKANENTAETSAESNTPQQEKLKSKNVALAALVAGGVMAVAGLSQHQKETKKAEEQPSAEKKKTSFSSGAIITTIGVVAMGWAVYSLLKSPSKGVTLVK